MKTVLSAAFGSVRALLIASLLMLPFSAPFQSAHAAASSQTTHAFLCRPAPAVGASGSVRVVNPNTSTAYQLNNDGCGVIANADIGYFLSQGYYYGPSLFTLQTVGVTGSGTASVSTGLTLPAYGVIVSFVICETAGNAVTGGLNIGDSGSATRYGSGVALSANACVSVSPTVAFFVNSGVPTASTILLAAATSWNSASVNVTVLYSYF